MDILFSNFKTDKLDLKNRIAMAPLTRSRAIGNIPNDMMAKYYALRASAGLIITEGTAPSPNGLGYPNIPGIFSQQQIDGWKKVTDAVHANGGKIFIQFMHTGRIAHELNLPEGAEIIGPSAIAAEGDMFTSEGLKPNGLPREMSLEDIKKTQDEFVQSAKNAIHAGFDGVEIHAANGYLPDQFLNIKSNTRTDEYGGSIENRTRFVLEVVEKTVAAIGSEKTGIRFSPYGVFNDMSVYDTVPETYQHLLDELKELDLAYIHLLDVTAMGASGGSKGFLFDLVKDYPGTVMFNGGWINKLDEAETLVQGNDKYLISIGAAFIANPDLIERLKSGSALNQADQNTFYTPGEEGYLTYPTLQRSE
ncbi:MAG: alkene reductase [Spirochaetota bacterium]